MSPFGVFNRFIGEELGLEFDDDMIAELVRDYGNMLYFLARHYVDDGADAEDIVQDVFMALIKKRNIEHDGIKAWLIRATINRCLDFIKKNKRIIRSEYAYSLAEENRNAETELYDALMRLGKYERETIFLFYYCGYSVGDVAKVMRKSNAAVRKCLERGRNKLKVFLEEGNNE